MADDIRDRVYGCLIGGAIGDALGAPVEGWTAARIRDEYGKMDEFVSYDLAFSGGEPGMVTDDSTLRQYVALAIAENDGRVTPDTYAPVLCEHMSENRVWVPEEIALKKLLAGVDPWDAGEGTVPTATTKAAMTPVGIINACNPRQAYQDGYDLASVHQDDIEQGAAATVAATVAVALQPDATAEQAVEAMQSSAPDILARGLDLGCDLAARSDSVDEFADQFYDELLDWRWPPVRWDRERYQTGELFSGSSLEILPAVAGLLTLCGDSPNRALVEAASFGRDCDTIASLVGSITGAVDGADSFDEDWIRQCERANRPFFEELENDPEANFRSMADRLVEALEHEQEQAATRAQTLEALLDG